MIRNGATRVISVSFFSKFNLFILKLLFFKETDDEDEDEVTGNEGDMTEDEEEEPIPEPILNLREESFFTFTSSCWKWRSSKGKKEYFILKILFHLA